LIPLLIDPRAGWTWLIPLSVAIEQLLLDGLEEFVNQRRQAGGIMLERNIKRDLSPVACSFSKLDRHPLWARQIWKFTYGVIAVDAGVVSLEL